MAPEPRGILDPGAIDRITTAEDGATLHITQSCPWDGSDHLLLLVQEKLFNYLAFVADGELARIHPGHRSRWQVAVDCFGEPDARTRRLFDEAGRQFEALGGSLILRVRPPSSPSPH